MKAVRNEVTVKEDQVVSAHRYARQALSLLEGHIQIDGVRGYISSAQGAKTEKEIGGCSQIILEIVSPQKSNYPKHLKWMTKAEVRVRVDDIEVTYFNIVWSNSSFHGLF